MEKDLSQDKQQFTAAQRPAATPLSTEEIKTGSPNFTEVRHFNRKPFLIAGIVFLVIITGAIFYFNFKTKKEIKQKIIAPKERNLKQQGTMEVFSPSETATEGATVPTISEDTSLDTIEKEIQSLQVEGLDKGDASVESDLQKL